MVDLSEIQLFDSDEHGQQRSIVFAIVVATGFLTVVAGAATLAAGADIAVGAVLLVLGVVVLGLGGLVGMGEADEYLFESA